MRTRFLTWLMSWRTDVTESKVKWHPYPKEKPKDDGYYIVTINPFLNSYPVVTDFWKSMTACDEDFSKTETVSFWERYGGQVLAWAELPEPYEQEAQDE